MTTLPSLFLSSNFLQGFGRSAAARVPQLLRRAWQHRAKSRGPWSIDETAKDAHLAEEEWQRATRQQGLSQFKATPSVDLRPADLRAVDLRVVVRDAVLRPVAFRPDVLRADVLRPEDAAVLPVRSRRFVRARLRLFSDGLS